MEGCSDGEIMAYMDDTAGEGDILGVVLGGAGEHFGGEILELDGLGDSTWFVEAVHVEVVIEEMEVVGKKKEGLYRFPEMIIVPSEKRSIRTHQDKYYRPLSR